MNKYDKISEKYILFVVENNPVPLDTIVWNEAKSASKIYNNIIVLCSKVEKENKYHRIIDNIDIYMYPNIMQGSNTFSIIIEYILAFTFIAIYSLILHIKKPFQIILLAKPSDFLSFIYFPYKILNVKIWNIQH